jgi:hypothetical protein
MRPDLEWWQDPQPKEQQMAPLAAMILGSVVRTVITAAGAGTVATGVVQEGANEWQVAIGALLVAIAQVWSLVQKQRAASA